MKCIVRSCRAPMVPVGRGEWRCVSGECEAKVYLTDCASMQPLQYVHDKPARVEVPS